MDGKVGHFFTMLKCPAKVNLAFAPNQTNLEDGGCRYFNAHENKTPLDRYKFVCSMDDLAKLKDTLNKTDAIESCSREKVETKLRSYK